LRIKGSLVLSPVLPVSSILENPPEALMINASGFFLRGKDPAKTDSPGPGFFRLSAVR